MVSWWIVAFVAKCDGLGQLLSTVRRYHSFAFSVAVSLTFVKYRHSHQ